MAMEIVTNTAKGRIGREREREDVAVFVTVF